MESIQLETVDGVTLDADVARPRGAARGGAVICHPHPAYGGDRFNPVVEALFGALPEAGFTALRFDFRPGAGSGAAERQDVVAAIDALVATGTDRICLAGYSFGAAIALGTRDRRIGALVAIAPPLSMMQVSDPGVPTLVLTPRHDQFCPPDSARAVVSAWGDCAFEVVESADHFLAGHTADVAGRAVNWLATRYPSA